MPKPPKRKDGQAAAAARLLLAPLPVVEVLEPQGGHVLDALIDALTASMEPVADPATLAPPLPDPSSAAPPVPDPLGIAPPLNGWSAPKTLDVLPTDLSL